MAVVGYGLAWMAGIMGGIGDTINSDLLRAAGVVGRLVLPSDVLWRGAMFALSPPEDVLNAGGIGAQAFRVSPFFSGSAAASAVAALVRGLDRRRPCGRHSAVAAPGDLARRATCRSPRRSRSRRTQTLRPIRTFSMVPEAAPAADRDQGEQERHEVHGVAVAVSDAPPPP